MRVVFRKVPDEHPGDVILPLLNYIAETSIFPLENATTEETIFI